MDFGRQEVHAIAGTQNLCIDSALCHIPVGSSLLQIIFMLLEYLVSLDLIGLHDRLAHRRENEVIRCQARILAGFEQDLLFWLAHRLEFVQRVEVGVVEGRQGSLRCILA